MPRSTTLLVLALALWCAVRAQEPCGSDVPPCFDATCGLNIDTHVLELPCACDAEDVGYQFTACNDTSNTRDVVFYWLPPATCQGGIPLPDNVRNVPCDLTCPPGYFLDTTGGGLTCSPCGAGTYTTGGGVLFEHPFDMIPAQFSTECIAADRDCAAWGARGAYIDSGDNLGKDNLQSLLNLQFHLVRPGFISFQYMYSSEYADYFVFSDNGKLLLAPLNSYQWRNFSAPLAEGHHLLRWIYDKDFSVSEFLDRVQLRYIEITGLHNADMLCTVCPPGTFSGSASAECTDCPANTYSSVYGATECTPCHADEKSFPGAIECIPDVICGMYDYGLFATGPCINGQQTAEYRWLQPMECNATNSVLPPNENIVCDGCPSGTQPGPENTCVTCPWEQASGGPNTVCNECQGGFEPHNYVRHFDSWPVDNAAFRTFCVGDCGSPGWRMGGTFIDSGAGHGPNTRSMLFLTLPFEKSHTVMSVDFEYTLECEGDSSLAFSIDGIDLWEAPCPEVCMSLTRSARIDFPEDELNGTEHTLIWRFSKVAENDNLGAGCDEAKLTRVTVYGRGDGAGAAECSPCLAGSASNGYECVACAPGTYAGTAQQTICQQCPRGDFSVFAGSTACEECGDGTTANAVVGATGCVTSCTYNRTATATAPAATFDFRKLSQLSGVVGPVYSKLASEMQFYLSLCGPMPQSSICGTLPPDTWQPVGEVPESHVLPTHVCIVDTSKNQAINAGSVIGFEVHMPQPGEGATTPTMTLQFDYGAGNCDGGTMRRTTVELVCDPGAGTGWPVDTTPATLDPLDRCYNTLRWNTLYACPVCTAADYAPVYGVCTNGQQSVSYYPDPSHRCWGGVTLPTAATQDCEEMQVAPPGSYVLPSGVAGGIIAAVITVIAAIIVVIVVQYRKRRALMADYANLQRRANLGQALDDMPTNSTIQ